MQQLLENTLTGGALILITAALRRVLRGRLHPDAWVGLWGLCLARLLTPVSWNSGLSLYGLAGRLAAARQSGTAVGQFSAAGAGHGSACAGLPWLYAGVALLLAAWFVRNWVVAHREVNCTTPLRRRDRRYRLMPRWVRLREGPMRGAPLTFGALRPTVVLAPGLRGRELECVLAHEGVHARRRDNLWHYAVALAMTLHWFNPAVWLMAALLRRDVELSCDRAALNVLGTQRRAEYARALISLSTQTEGPAFCRSFGPKRVEERIIAVMKYKKTGITGIVLAVAIAASLTMVFASTPDQDKPDDGIVVNYVVSTEDGQTKVSRNVEADVMSYEYDQERGVFVTEDGREFTASKVFDISNGSGSSMKVEVEYSTEDGLAIETGTYEYDQGQATLVSSDGQKYTVSVSGLNGDDWNAVE